MANYVFFGLVLFFSEGAVAASVTGAIGQKSDPTRGESLLQLSMSAREGQADWKAQMKEAEEIGTIASKSSATIQRGGHLRMPREKEKQTEPSETLPDNCFASYIRSPSCSKSFPGLESVFGKSLELLPPIDVLATKASRCAVVSSSPRMLAHDHGNDIDEHDIVFRFNDAAVEGFEKHVGSKTDILVINDQLPLREPRDLSWLPLKAAPVKVWRSWHKEFPYNGTFHGLENYAAIRRDHQDTTHYLLNFHFYKFVEELLGFHSFKSSSTGFLGVALALQMCKSVDVYEIVPSSASEQGKKHYYQALLDTVDDDSQHADYCPHDCQKEHSFLMKHNTLPDDVVKRDGILHLSAANNPEIQFCHDQRP